MSRLKIGLVTSNSDESQLLAKLLENNGGELIYNIEPAEITETHVENQGLNVWLLNIDDDSWHDTVDHLLDESEIPVFFSEPGNLVKQSHPEFWCVNLIERLYEITGLKKESLVEEQVSIKSEPVPDSKKSIENKLSLDEQTPLDNSLDKLQVSSMDLPSDIAAELVNELESISPVLSEIPDEIPRVVYSDDISLTENESLTSQFNPPDEELQPDDEIILDDFELENNDLVDSDLEDPNLFDSEQVASDLDVYELEDTDLEQVKLVETDTNEIFETELGLDDNLHIQLTEEIDGKQDPQTLENNTFEEEIDFEVPELVLETQESLHLEVNKAATKSNISNRIEASESVSTEFELEPELVANSKLEIESDEYILETETALDKAATEKSSKTDTSLAFNEEDKADLMSELSLDDDFDIEAENQELPDVKLDVSQKTETQHDQISEDLDAAELLFDEINNNEESIDLESLEFEIPMLDETASNMEFEVKDFVPNQTQETPCWVIGASLGGPAAVKRFIHSLPKDINASFIIAQHIDESFLPVLADILTSNSEFKIEVAKGSNPMFAGKMLIAPLKGKVIFLSDGSLFVDHSQKWSAPYSPCINDVIESVSKSYRNLAGAIIFSGMGNDGLNGAKKMREQGGLVWVQSPDTCANASMPEAIINEGEADFIGSPEELAEKLVLLLNP